MLKLEAAQTCEVTPKSFVSNFWGAVHLLDSLMMLSVVLYHNLLNISIALAFAEFVTST